MKRIIFLGTLLFTFLFLFGCASRNNPYPHSDMSKETWFHSVDTSAAGWARGASRWFLTGDPNVIEEKNYAAPYSSAMSTMMVRVPEFVNVMVDGPFQVQLYGSYEQNSVYVYGPNAGVRDVVVEVRGDTLYVAPVKEATNVKDMKRVIIRIGMVNLHKLTASGSGRVEGRQLRSTNMEVNSSGTGNLYLAGNVNLRCINQRGAGTVSVFGAVTRSLDISTNGSGCVNVSGDIGLRMVKHAGSGNINIIGANGGNARIFTDGSGKIGINGRVHLCEVNAKGKTCVYAYYVTTNALNVYTYDKATVGLAGVASNLYVSSSGASNFLGRYLHTQDAYVKAYDSAHINVTASNRIYASATDSSSVYFFGSPRILSQFASGSGVVMPIWYDARSYPAGLKNYQTYQPTNSDPTFRVRQGKAVAYPYKN